MTAAESAEALKDARRHPAQHRGRARPRPHAQGTGRSGAGRLSARPLGRPGQRAGGHLAAVVRPGRDHQAGAAALAGSTTPGCCWSWPRPRPTPIARPRSTREVAALRKAIDELEVRTLLSGEYDAREALVTIRAGAGGVDAADFAEMLLRMYLRWAERHGYPTEVYDTSYAEEAGLKSATFAVKAPYAYGTLSVEAGTHRLVRISPFDNQGRRQTSFAAFEVVPVVEQTDQIDIPEDEIRVDVYRSSGPGGQGVNTTDSAVRLTHLPDRASW